MGSFHSGPVSFRPALDHTAGNDYTLHFKEQLKPFGPHFDWIIDLDPNFLFFFFFFCEDNFPFKPYNLEYFKLNPIIYKGFKLNSIISYFIN